MAQSSKPQGTRQAGERQPKGGRGQQQQQIPPKNLMGPGGDPVEGRPDIGTPPKE